MVSDDYQKQYNPRAADDLGEYAMAWLTYAQRQLRTGLHTGDGVEYLNAAVSADRALDSLKRAVWNTATHKRNNDAAIHAAMIILLADVLFSRKSNTAAYKATKLLCGGELTLTRETTLPGLGTTKIVPIVWEDYTMTQMDFVVRLSTTHWRLMPLRRRFVSKHLDELLCAGALFDH